MFQGERAWHAHDIRGAKFKVMRFSSRRDEVYPVLCHITNFILPRLHLYVYHINEMLSIQCRHISNYITRIFRDLQYIFLKLQNTNNKNYFDINIIKRNALKFIK